MANITSSNFIDYCDKLVGSFAKARYAEGGYPTIQAGYGTYDSKSTAHKTLCILYGSFSDTSLIEATTPCTDIPKGFTVAIEENNTITEYQYKKVMPDDGYTANDLEVKGAANIKKKSADASPLPVVNGTVTLNLTASDITYNNSTVNNALLGIEEDIHLTKEDIGTLSDLNTQTKQSLVAATNEVNSKAGNLSNLATTNKSSLVSAINEVISKTSYVLIPSMSAIRRDSNGVPEVDFVNCTVKKLIGSNEYIEPTNNLFYIINGENMYQGAHVDLTPNDGIYSIEFILQPNVGMVLDSDSLDNTSMSVPLASVTVTITKDGQKGEKGDNGVDGARGSRGAILRGPSEWKPNVLYMGGAEGEEYQDMVLREIDGQAYYYLCHYTHTSSYDNIPDSHNNPSQWSSTTPWQVSQTGDFVATKVLFAERATIGNVNIQGTITEECEDFHDNVTTPPQVTVPIFLVGKDELKSIYVRDTNTEGDDYKALIQLPTYNAIQREGIPFRSYEYRQAGTRLSIFTTPVTGFESWAGFPFDIDPEHPESYLYGENLQDLLNNSTLVCADPQSLIGYYNTTTGKVQPEHEWGGATTHEPKQNRFSYNGRYTRFVLLLPGQHLDLISHVECVGYDSNDNPINTLVWDICNTADFEPAGIMCYHGLNVPQSASSSYASFYASKPDGFGANPAGKEAFLAKFMPFDTGAFDTTSTPTSGNPIQLQFGLAYNYTNGNDSASNDYPSWNFILTT